MSSSIVFAGTPEFAIPSLKALLGSEHRVVAVYTQPDRAAGRGRELQGSPVKHLALRHQIPVYQPNRLNDYDAQKPLHDLHPDLIIVAAYGLILPKAVLAIPKYGCINVHASLLPRWRGAAPIQHAILAGDQESGITIMQMDVGLDTGDMILSKSCAIDPNDTGKTLEDRLKILGAEALLESLEQFKNQTVSHTKQNSSLATYAPKIVKSDALIVWDQNATVICRKIRAFNPWPVAYTSIGDQTLRIWRATLLSTTSNQLPGTIIEVNQEGITVSAGKGAIRLEAIQLAGGKRLPVKEILKSRSHLFSVGSVFK